MYFYSSRMKIESLSNTNNTFRSQLVDSALIDRRVVENTNLNHNRKQRFV